MLLVPYIKWFSLFLTSFLVVEQVPLIKTIDSVPSEASQLLSTVSEFASGVKDGIVEMVSRPSDFFQENESNQSSPDPAPSPATVEPPPEFTPEPPQPSETPHVPCSEPQFWRVEGSKIRVTMELDMAWIPGYVVLGRVFGWVACWFGVLFPGGSGTGSAWQSSWLHAVLPAALGFFGGWGYGFAGWCRCCLSRKKPPKTVVRIEQVVIAKEPGWKTQAIEYFQHQLNQAYMLPFGFQNFPDPRRLTGSAEIAATKSQNAEGTNPAIDGIAKKEEDSDPMVVPASLSDSSWYSPESPVSPTKVNSDGLELPSYDGFQPRPRVSDPDDLPNSLLGPSPSVTSLPQPPEPRLPRISDPWSNYTPDPNEQATPS